MRAQPSGAHPSADLADDLHSRGLRRTIPRMTILAILEQVGTHLNVTELTRLAIAVHPTINASTVYRNVAAMRDVGVLHSIDYAGETLFGLAAAPHHHLVCDQCGTLTEIPAEALGLTTRCGFRLSPAGQVLHGHCQGCAGAS
ncbi:Fur family transcriptional regulator [Nonomuraea sp. NPDC050394]|uniref:Fur family transcriptional regulator n=1 Tax=Nonomuraea sp. NPDC050394 TaxID=3364363 RepID=UPI0037986A6E